MPGGGLPLGGATRHTTRVTTRERLAEAGQLRSVPVRGAGLPRRPRVARDAVGHLDVPEAPLDLGQRVGAVVGAELRHLASRQGLRHAVGAGARVLGEPAPVALAGPAGAEAV